MITLTIPAAAFDRDEVEVAGDAYRHLFRARRLAVGDRVRLTDGGGRARWSTVEEVDRRRARLRPGEPAATREPSWDLDLVVAALRPERAAWLVEKATEIGVRAVRFLRTGRTPRDYGAARLERWRRVATAAVEQCHRARIPEVTGVHEWRELAAYLEGAGDAWYLSAESGRPVASLAANGRSGSGVVLVGPEGGWTADEQTALDDLGLAAASLGPRVLRVETAAVAAAAMLLLSS